NLLAQRNDQRKKLLLDLRWKHDLAARYNLLNMRTQLARLRIDNRELVFDAQGEGVFLCTHGGLRMSSKTQRLSSRANGSQASCLTWPTGFRPVESLRQARCLSAETGWKPIFRRR